MSTRLRLDLIVRTYPVDWDPTGEVAGYRWTWRLWSGSRIVSTSGSQLFSRRIDCARGAEVGAGLGYVVEALKDGGFATRGLERVQVRVLDEREARP